MASVMKILNCEGHVSVPLYLLIFLFWMSSFLVYFNILGGILEIGAQWAIEMRDADAFERYMAQLKPYYLDYRSLLSRHYNYFF